MLMFIIISFLIISSCTSKKDITYINEVDSFNITDINKQKIAYTIQADDIISVKIHSMIPEAAIIYNRISEKIKVIYLILIYCNLKAILFRLIILLVFLF